ncbi:hypothetical protein LC040_04170 [Bacillus tianshenii]|nr:hypothetical protein LC040_04170 [Bacillus tianshenii]
MSQFVYALLALIFITSLISLVYTYQIGKQMEKANSEYDKEVNTSVRAHHILRNPVFLSYIIASVLIIFYLMYLIMRGPV